MTDTNIVQSDRRHPIAVLSEKLEARKGELKKALGDIDPDHFIRTMITAATIDPKLQACSFNSLWIACLRACRDHLLPDGREGVILPFKDTATWVPMYQGLLKRFRDSGQCKWITANVVREGETFTHYIDQTGEHFHHIPDGNEKSPVIKVYAAALTRDDAFYVAVMSMSEIEEIKKESRANRPESPVAEMERRDDEEDRAAPPLQTIACRPRHLPAGRGGRRQGAQANTATLARRRQRGPAQPRRRRRAGNLCRRTAANAVALRQL